MTISATEFKTNLGKYIDIITAGNEEIIVTKNGKKVLSVQKPALSATERLASLVTSNRKWDYEDLKKGALSEKYEIAL